MRWLLLILSLSLAGCTRTKSNEAKTSGRRPASTPPTKTVVSTNKPSAVITLSMVVQGKVALVNPNARHAILSFPIGQMPALEQRLNVYRAGLKVGEVKVTGPKRDTNVAADIVAGECRVGDEVRDD